MTNSYRIIVVLCAIATILACGTLPPTVNKLEYIDTPTQEPDHVDDMMTNIPDHVMVKTLGKLNVRECPSTSCAVVGVLEADVYIRVGAMVTNEIVDCNRWYPLEWRGKRAWVCADWVSKYLR